MSGRFASALSKRKRRKGGNEGEGGARVGGMNSKVKDERKYGFLLFLYVHQRGMTHQHMELTWHAWDLELIPLHSFGTQICIFKSLRI